jgi:hypothetical protein
MYIHFHCSYCRCEQSFKEEVNSALPRCVPFLKKPKLHLSLNGKSSCVNIMLDGKTYPGSRHSFLQEKNSSRF